MKTRMVQLGDVAEIGAGQGAPQDPAAFSREGHAFIRAASLEALCNSGSLTFLERVSAPAAAKHRLRLCPVNTVVFAKSGMSATKNRVYRLREPCYVVNHLATVEPGTEVDPTFLRYWFEHFDPTTLIQDTAYPSISQEDIGAVQLPLPSLPEQRRIAGMLEQADRLRRTRRFALELSDTFLPAAFLEMFGDPVKNERKWSSAALDVVSDKITDGEHLNPSFVPDGPPIVMAEQVEDSGVNLTSCKHVSEADFATFTRKCAPKLGDILVVSRGATIGRTCVVNTARPFCLMGSVILVQPCHSKVVSQFLAAQLKSASFLAVLRTTSGASAQQAIYIAQLRDKAVVLPPLPLQQRFADLVRGHERLRAAQRESLRQAEHLFQSLLHRAFEET